MGTAYRRSRQKWVTCVSDFVDGVGTTWLDLPGGRRVEVKDELSYGEDKVLQGYSIKAMQSAGESYGPDYERWLIKRNAAWIVNWDLVDKDKQPVPVSEAAIRALKPAMGRAIDEALSQHIEDYLKNSLSATGAEKT